MELTTSSGFSLNFDPELVNDMEVMDCLVAMEKGDVTAISRICSLVLDPETKVGLYNHCRNEKGRVPIERVTEEITEIFSLSGKSGKNS